MESSAETPETTPATRFRSGLTVGAGLAAAAFLLAVSFGAIAQAQGWGSLAPIVCSLVVFSGSAQFALLSTLGAGGGVASAVLAAALINSRFLPMGVAVADDLRGGVLRRALEGQTVVDGSWAAAHRGGGRFDRYVLFGASAAQWPAWVAGTALGVAVAPDPALLHTLGLDVLTPALFVTLLFDEVRSERAHRLPAALGALLAGGLVFLVPPGVALIGAASAALVVLLRPTAAPVRTPTPAATDTDAAAGDGPTGAAEGRADVRVGEPAGPPEDGPADPRADEPTGRSTR